MKYFNYAARNIPCEFNSCMCPGSPGNRIMYSFVYIKNNFMYYSIPKCASTTIINSIFNLPRFSITIPEENINYFRFTFVRNPFSRVVSNYSMFTQQPKRISQIKKRFENFKEFVLFINEKHNHHWQPMNLFLPEPVDFVGRVENFQKDFDKLCALLNMKSRYKLQNKTTHLDYREYYDSETKDIIYKKYEKDFKMFGYEF